MKRQNDKPELYQAQCNVLQLSLISCILCWWFSSIWSVKHPGYRETTEGGLWVLQLGGCCSAAQGVGGIAALRTFLCQHSSCLPLLSDGCHQAPAPGKCAVQAGSSWAAGLKPISQKCNGWQCARLCSSSSPCMHDESLLPFLKYMFSFNREKILTGQPSCPSFPGDPGGPWSLFSTSIPDPPRDSVDPSSTSGPFWPWVIKMWNIKNVLYYFPHFSL